MRNSFISALTHLAEREARVVLLTGDLGYNVLEPFAAKCPDRFYNVGVAEQNMVGLATGLAEAGFIPFVYSIVNFAVLRPYEFIRNGPILHRLPVRIVGVGGGLDYGPNGTSHHGLEDIGVLRIQPGVTIVAPADCAQASTALLETWDLPGPVYYRLGKGGEPAIPELGGRFGIEHIEFVREGGGLVFIAAGSVAREAIAAADLLADRGVACSVAVVAAIAPPPVAELACALAHFPLALTVEAHYAVGGIGSLVSEVIADHGLGCRLVRCGVRDVPDGVSGSQAYLYRLHGLSGDTLAATALEAWQAHLNGKPELTT